MNDDIKNFTQDHGAGEIYRGHLRSVATGNRPEEPGMVEMAPDGMGGQDAASKLSVEQRSDTADAHEAYEGLYVHEEPPASTIQPEADERREDSDASEDDELRYADGSTATAVTPRRSFRRRRGVAEAPADEEELADTIAATQVDVWAAHRDPASNETEPREWAQAPAVAAPLTGAESGRKRSRRAIPVLATALAVGLVVGASAILGGGARSDKPPATKGHHASDTGTTVTTPAHHVPAVHTPRTTKPAAKRHAHRHHKNKRTAARAQKTETTLTVTTTQQSVPPTHTYSTPTVSNTPTTPTVSSTPTTAKDTATTNHATSVSTHSASGSKSSAGSATTPPGALPDVKQTQQQP